MKFKHIRKALLFSMLFFAFSCTDDFHKINTSLDSIVDLDESGSQTAAEGIHLGDTISADELSALEANISEMGAIFRKLSYEGVYDDYQRSTNLTHDIYAGYFANLNPSFLYLSPTYDYTASWSDKRWEHFFMDRTVEYGSLVRSFWFVEHNFETGQGNYLNAYYITRIYYAFLISMQTDTYGDLPLTNLHLQGIPDTEAPKYRTQEEIYDIIFEMLDDAVNNIKPGDNQFNLGDDDRCYGGDVDKWVRFANTLRLRLALRISNVDPAKAQEQGEAAMNHPAGLMQGQADNMRTIPNYAPVSMGGENSGGDENIYALCSYTWSDSGMNKDIEVAYKTLSDVLDPRCEISWYRPLDESSTIESPLESDADYLGVITGDENIQKPSYMHSRLKSYAVNGKELRDDAWFGLSRESVWLSYSESLFLLSEAALRGWSGATGAPFDFFMDGIKASLDYYNISPDKQHAYMDGLVVLGAENPFFTDDNEAILEQIITQKWLSVFPNGNEGWAEFRRTDYPSFIHLPTMNNAWDVEPGKFIKRISYPGDESLLNPNFPFIDDNELRQDDRMWWDVSDTNDALGNRRQPDNFRNAGAINNIIRKIK